MRNWRGEITRRASKCVEFPFVFRRYWIQSRYRRPLVNRYVNYLLVYALLVHVSSLSLVAEIPIKKVNVNPTKTLTVNKRASSLVASDVEVNSMAKKAFTSYVKGYNLMPNKDVFDVSSLDLEEYAKSLGLGKQPSVRFLREGGGREENREKKNKSRKLERLKEVRALERSRRRRELGRTIFRHCEERSDEH